jgi:hypothetical protein
VSLVGKLTHLGCKGTANFRFMQIFPANFPK